MLCGHPEANNSALFNFPEIVHLPSITNTRPTLYGRVMDEDVPPSFPHLTVEEDDELAAAGDVELSENRVKCRLYGGDTPPEAIGDIGIAQTCCDQTRNLFFPRRKLVKQERIRRSGAKVSARRDPGLKRKFPPN